MRNLYYIAIEGPIGVGKTSLAQLLSKELGARLVLEDLKIIHFYQIFIMILKGLVFKLNCFFFYKGIVNNKI